MVASRAAQDLQDDLQLASACWLARKDWDDVVLRGKKKELPPQDMPW